MDKLTDREEELKKNKEKERLGFFKGLGVLFTEVKSLAKKERNILYDLAFVCVGFLFARCHLLFGAYPLALAFVSSLPLGVFGALLGAVIGSLTLGRIGMVFAIVTVISAFIRVIISSGEGEGGVFGENTLLKMCSSVIGGFICSAYQVLLSGFNESSVLFSVSMILIPPSMTFVFSGLFSMKHTLRAILVGSENIFSFSGKSEKDRLNVIYFEISCLVFLFFLTLSLGGVEIFGISASYVFVSFVTLIAAKRFGALRALAVGFVSSLGVSGVYSVSFALLGLGAGCLFGFGMGYGLISGGGALVLWSVYSSGLVGLVSTLPEYTIAAILSIPILRKISPESTVSENERVEKDAKDMIGAMSLVYQKRYCDNLDALELSLSGIPEIMKKRTALRLSLDFDECESLVKSAAYDFCTGCPGRDYCRSENICPAAKNAPSLAAKMLSGVPIEASDINLSDEFCQFPEEVAETVLKAAARAQKDKYEKNEAASYGAYELISTLLSEARMQDDSERSVNAILSDKLTAALSEHGFGSGVGRVFGERRLHLIVAGKDTEGEKITSEELKAGIEESLNIRLGTQEFFRREEMVLMECNALPIYTVEYAVAFSPMEEGVCSGDSVRLFESDNGYFYSLISDGMGSGEVAGNTSGFVCDYLEKMLNFSASKETVLHLLNLSLRQRGTECSATVDLFGMDLTTGEVTFIKSGAAPSYVKRESSIFRLRSKTAPLGLLSTIDTEKLRVEVRPSDLVIMFSDGICQSDDDSTWLVELLSRPYKGGLKDYAEYILSEAKRSVSVRDDMSVVVLQIKESKEGNIRQAVS